ncbi:hypothetical protein B0H17DRAFT_1144778 [Mycena rosella]|uniref:Uncharacterized protein n=1 Tax=Mycena rosella TaxID=1033263 RepID=A0AAD7G6M1_MYCRO|nr:hypothetical protein B0H17DRAFT_1144778 [Mycena rosella]
MRGKKPEHRTTRARRDGAFGEAAKPDTRAGGSGRVPVTLLAWQGYSASARTDCSVMWCWVALIRWPWLQARDQTSQAMASLSQARPDRWLHLALASGFNFSEPSQAMKPWLPWDSSDGAMTLSAPANVQHEIKQPKIGTEKHMDTKVNQAERFKECRLDKHRYALADEEDTAAEENSEDDKDSWDCVLDDSADE